MKNETLLLPALRSAASKGSTAQQVSARQLSTVAALCLIEARPAVQAMVLLRFTAAVLLGTGPVVPDRPVICGCAAMVFISTCVYLVNGITDLAGDVAMAPPGRWRADC